RLPREVPAVDNRHDDGHADQECRQQHPRVGRDGGHDGYRSEDRVQEEVVDLLAVGRTGQIGSRRVAVGLPSTDTPPRPFQTQGGTASDIGPTYADTGDY